jgi:hypothetical protein
MSQFDTRFIENDDEFDADERPGNDVLWGAGMWAFCLALGLVLTLVAHAMGAR